MHAKVNGMKRSVRTKRGGWIAIRVHHPGLPSYDYLLDAKGQLKDYIPRNPRRTFRSDPWKSTETTKCETSPPTNLSIHDLEPLPNRFKEEEGQPLLFELEYPEETTFEHFTA
jgi:hypothetical protein